MTSSTGSIDHLIEAMPFAAALGIELATATAAEVRGQLDWHPDRCTVGGVLHGGALITFADSLGAICAYLNLPPGAGTATIESKTNLFRAVRGGQVRGVSHPLHVGRSTIVVQTDLYDEQDRRVAQVTQTQSVLPAGSD
jgi:1,4-dihydroxy-2-naphthoyl-CoA hydrolase